MRKKTIIIDSNKNENIFLKLNELFLYKDLFTALTIRDFKVRYAQTAIGLFWAILQPIFTLAILSLVFNKFIGVETKIPHLLFTVAGTSIWSYFSYILINSGNSLVGNQNLIKKIYFPRLIIPLSKSIVGFIDFFIVILIMCFLMLYFKISPSENILFAPFFVFMGIVSALSVGIWVSALSVRYRDFQHIVPFIVQIGLYITPIAYPAEFATRSLPKWAESIYYLNPMTGVIQGFRWSVFGGNNPNILILVSFSIIIILFITGIIYFNKTESKIADII